MRTLHAIISQYVKDETSVEISRRELRKIKAELKRPYRSTVTTRLMNTSRLPHEGKCYWPPVYEREAPKGQGQVRTNTSPEHPMVTARKRQYVRPSTQMRTR